MPSGPTGAPMRFTTVVRLATLIWFVAFVVATVAGGGVIELFHGDARRFWEISLLVVIAIWPPVEANAIRSRRGSAERAAVEADVIRPRSGSAERAPLHVVVLLAVLVVPGGFLTGVLPGFGCDNADEDTFKGEVCAIQWEKYMLAATVIPPLVIVGARLLGSSRQSLAQLALRVLGVEAFAFVVALGFFS